MEHWASAAAPRDCSEDKNARAQEQHKCCQISTVQAWPNGFRYVRRRNRAPPWQSTAAVHRWPSRLAGISEPCYGQAMAERVIRKVTTYKRTKSFARWCRRVKSLSRGACERCGGTCGPDHLTVHHILESRIYPEFARESCNILLLCVSPALSACLRLHNTLKHPHAPRNPLRPDFEHLG